MDFVDSSMLFWSMSILIRLFDCSVVLGKSFIQLLDIEVAADMLLINFVGLGRCSRAL